MFCFYQTAEPICQGQDTRIQALKVNALQLLFIISEWKLTYKRQEERGIIVQWVEFGII